MDLSLVVPSFKQAPTIRRDLQALSAFLETLEISYEIILVVDGDIDGTAHVVQHEDTLKHVIIETLDKNYGKGYAVRCGLMKAQGETVGFLDAGGDIDLSCLKLMIDLMNFSDADIVIGSKRHILSEVKYPLMRRVYSAGYQLLNRMLFRLNVRDTQVGLKIFRQHVLQATLPYITIHRFAFDVELLALSSILGFKKIIESPIRINHTFRSTINTRAAMETLWDTLGLFIRMKVLHKIPFSRAASPSLSPGVLVSFLSPALQVEEKEHSAVPKQ